MSTAVKAAAPRVNGSPYCYSITTRFKDRHVLELLDVRPGETVLDAGCGSGYFVEQIAAAGGKPTGIDVSVPSLVFCRAHTPARYVASDADRMPFRDDVFDKVLFTDVIEHVYNDRGALAELVRVTRPGGAIVVTTPALEGPLTGSRLNRLFHDDASSPEHHVVDGYSASSLRALMSEVGIEVDAVRYTTYLLSEMAIEAMKVSYWLVGKRLHDQTDLARIQRGLPFQLYRLLVFPVLLAMGRLEERLMGNRPYGHLILVRGRVRGTQRV